MNKYQVVSRYRPRKVPDLNTMWKFMLNRNLGNQRRTLYAYLNNALGSGELSRIVGFDVKNWRITREVCELVRVELWKIDRESFYADVKVRLHLQSSTDIRVWDGVLVCWCCFDPDFELRVKALCGRTDHRKDGLVPMDLYTVPYYDVDKLEKFAERIWLKYNMPEALYHPSLRNAAELAHRMGLQIMYLDVYEHPNVKSILFFENSTLLCGEDRMDVLPNGQKIRIKTSQPEEVEIPANTIVINTNKCSAACAAFHIFHECIHYEFHYMFYCLQQMASNDPLQMKMVETIDPKRKNPIALMESQANYCAYILMMPREDTLKRVEAARKVASGYKNAGGMYEIMARFIGTQIDVSPYYVRSRMVQLGFYGARGAMNRVDYKTLQPFAFSSNCDRSSKFTYGATYEFTTDDHTCEGPVELRAVSEVAYFDNGSAICWAMQQ